MDSKNAKILIIDDDPGIRFFLKEYLLEIGYESEQAKDGQEGIDKIDQQKPDLILCDMKMPGVDGLEVIKHVNKTDKNLPIITISGTGAISDVVNAIRHGAWDFLVKPFTDLDMIEMQVEKAMEKSRLIQENKNYQKNLEKLVEERTDALRKSNIKIQKMNETLEQKVEDRTAELRTSLENLRSTKKKLVESEKMASLGGLVAGIAHEINTPIGIGVTAASHFHDETEKIYDSFKNQRIKKSQLDSYMETANDSARIILNNLGRASKLIQSFKQVAVDQSAKEHRKFKLKEYVDEVLTSLKPKLKKTAHQVDLNIPEEITVDSYPGAISQIITNFVFNSLLHGFDSHKAGRIEITAIASGDLIEFIYRDNGKGIPEEKLSKIFDPFYTTKRGEGGSGLGMHVVYNLVTQMLCGSIDVRSTVGQGVEFRIKMPVQIENCEERNDGRKPD